MISGLMELEDRKLCYNIMKRKSNKWLLRKVSGSRGKYTSKPDYADFRNKKQDRSGYLPQKEPMGKGRTWLDTSLVKRWLYGQTQRNFDDVYSSFLKRIQPKYLESYKDCIFYYVDKPEEVRYKSNDSKNVLPSSSPFYIDPKSNLLEQYSEKEKKENHVRFIANELGTFSYKNTDQLILRSSDQTPTLFIHTDTITFSKEEIASMQSVLEQLDRVQNKAMEHIDNYALSTNVKNVTNARKSLLSIEFFHTKPSRTYHLCFDIASNSTLNWIVEFEEFVVREVRVEEV